MAKKKNTGVFTKKAPSVFKTPGHLPQGVSKEETELYNIIHLTFPKKVIRRSDRLVLDGKELDMYIPENKVAIEYDGVYFHSTAKKDNSFYHLWKTIECEKRGIRLIHVLSDEWELKRSLVIDNINRALGKFQVIEAEDCDNYELTKKEEEIFFENCHLNSYHPESFLCLGLLYQNQIVMAVTFVNNNGEYLIPRISYRKGIYVPGGLQKIINNFKKRCWEGDIYASIDRRFESPADLINCGFKEIMPTNPRATYTKDFKHRYSEKDFKKFDETTLLKGGWQKIYDCGRQRFLLKGIDNLNCN